MSVWGAPWASRKRRGLRAWVILILSRNPRTGAEIMDDMERMSAGRWRPSPGSVYPLLEELTQEGVTRKREDGRYELAQNMHEHSHWTFPVTGPRSPDEAVRDIGALVSYLEDLRRSDRDGFVHARDAMRQVSERLQHLIQEEAR